MKRHRFLKSIVTIAIVTLASVIFSLCALAAEIVLPDIISDHMLLQQGEEVTLWGTAGGHEEVAVKLVANGKTYLTGKATSGADGSFKINLPAIPPGGPFELQFSTKTAKKTVNDVLVGELWLMSGQSNMVRSTSATGSFMEKILPDKEINDIRLFSNTADEQKEERATNLSGKWVVASPSTVKSFSALGYRALKTMYDELDVPMGGICVGVNGKAMSYFYGPTSPGEPGGKLYNSKFAPIVDMTVRGVLWHQFEGDRDNEDFTERFNKLIKTWRIDRNDPALPVIFFSANTSPMRYVSTTSNETIVRDWSPIRLRQIQTYYDTDNVMFIVTTDFPYEGEKDPIHPNNKLGPGNRMGLTALGGVYGRVQQWQSPLYKVSKKNANSVEITFSHVYDGLKTTDGNAPRCFLVGATQTALKKPTSVEIISKDTVRITCEEIKEINYISYCMEGHLFPYKSIEEAVSMPVLDINLVNSADLPLASFFVKAGEERKEKTFTNFAVIGNRFDTVKREEKPKEEEKPQTPAPAPEKEEGIKILIDNEKLICDQPPVIIDGRTLVPMRAIFEKLGAAVSWDGATSTAAGNKDGKIVSFVIGESLIGIDSEKKPLDVPAQIVGGRTMIPARAVAEAFGCTVGWNGETQTVIITR